MNGNCQAKREDGGRTATAARSVTPRSVQERLASSGVGLSAETLARALQTRSHAVGRLPMRGRVLDEQEVARRYARAKELIAHRAKAARPAAPGQDPQAPVGAVAPPRGPIERCQRWAARAVRRAYGRGEEWGWRTVVCAGALLAAGLVLRHDAALWWHGGKAAASGGEGSPAWRLLSSREWFQRAQNRATEGNFRQALGTVEYGLASAPKNVDLLIMEGDMHQSLFQFVEAQRAYEKALRLQPANADAKQNITLCRRLNRYHDDASAHRSTLYGLHRVMLGQGRVSEAVAISRRLSTDQTLRQATWQAALDNTGLTGKITVGPAGQMDADLSGNLEPDLALLKGFPINGLNLADTGLEDLHALPALPLRRLDLTRTLVHDLAPLHSLPLEALRLRGTGVVELSALAGCPLRELDISNTQVGDLGPLAQMPLTSLRAANTPVGDLRPLATLPLTRLDLARTRVSDLGPLGSLGLQVLNLDGTRVADLSPLKGCRLHELYLSETGVRDLSPLAGMPLTVLTLSDCPAALDLRPLTSCEELEHLHIPVRPLFLDRLAALPHLRFVQRDETRLEDMMLLKGGAEPDRGSLGGVLLSRRGEIAVPGGR